MIEPIYQFFDPLEVEQHYKDRQVEIRVHPTAKGTFNYKKRTATVDGLFLRISEMETPWSMENLNDSDMFFLTVCSRGDAAWKVAGEWHGSLSVSIVDNLEVREARFSCNTLIDTVVIPASTLHSDLSAILGTRCQKRIRFDSSCSLGREQAAALIHVVAALKVGLAGPTSTSLSSLAVEYLRHALTTIVLQGVDHNYTRLMEAMPSDVTPARITRAIEFINANASDPIRITQIAEAASLSVRGLQVGFMRHTAMTPMAFLRKVRLQRVHLDLLDSTVEESCEQISFRWGFSNFYRFSKLYDETFGESPRETYRRVRSGRKK